MRRQRLPEGGYGVSEKTHVKKLCFSFRSTREAEEGIKVFLDRVDLD